MKWHLHDGYKILGGWVLCVILGRLGVCVLWFRNAYGVPALMGSALLLGVICTGFIAAMLVLQHTLRTPWLQKHGMLMMGVLPMTLAKMIFVSDWLFPYTIPLIGRALYYQLAWLPMDVILLVMLTALWLFIWRQQTVKNKDTTS